jgi:hypothetical protein
LHEKRTSGGETRLSQDQDGLKVHSAGWGSQIELLPRIPATRYRIIAKMRRDRYLTHEVQWGVFFRRGAVLTRKGQQGVFHAVWLAGWDDSAPALTVALQRRLFSDLIPLADRPYRDFQLLPQYSKPIANRPDPTDPWQTFVIDVTPEAVTATCRIGNGEPVSLGPLLFVDGEFHLRAALAFDEDLQTLRPEQLQGSGLGIFVRMGVCSVQQFVVQVIKDPE